MLTVGETMAVSARQFAVVRHNHVHPWDGPRIQQRDICLMNKITYILSNHDETKTTSVRRSSGVDDDHVHTGRPRRCQQRKLHKQPQLTNCKSQPQKKSTRQQSVTSRNSHVRPGCVKVVTGSADGPYLSTRNTYILDIGEGNDQVSKPVDSG